MPFAIYDPLHVGYMKPSWNLDPSPQKAKIWKRLKYAQETASLKNCPRNIPPGHSGPSKYYQALPNFEVHEFDATWNIVAKHAAPPQYISIII